MSAVASQITGVSSVYLNVCSGTDQRKHQNSASLAFVRGIHRWPVNSSHKEPVTQKLFSFDDVIIEPFHEELTLVRGERSQPMREDVTHETSSLIGLCRCAVPWDIYCFMSQSIINLRPLVEQTIDKSSTQRCLVPNILTTDPLWRESTGNRWVSLQDLQRADSTKAFRCHWASQKFAPYVRTLVPEAGTPRGDK